MIKFITEAWEWDLTNYGLTFNEESPYFSLKQKKNFSFPIAVDINEDLVDKLGLIHLEGATRIKKRIHGQLFIDRDFFDSYISINSIEGTKAELTFYYGKATLFVFDKKLKTLPFKVTATTDLRAYAKTLLSQQWPAATHQFVKVFREDISSKANYSDFQNFLNNYQDNAGTWEFVQNTNENVEGTIKAINRNVMAPMVYMLEVLKVGFASEQLELRGDLVNNSFFKKLLLVPQQFIEEFSNTQYLNYSFSNYTAQEQLNGQTINVYRQIHTPITIGSFSIKINVNMSSVMATYFKLTITHNNETLYEALSENVAVNINEAVDLNIIDSNIVSDISVELRLLQQTTSISAFNNFTYSYKEGQLNIFPPTYTIADYLPDMTFRDYYNKLKTWLNLKETYTDNAVYIDFIENAIEDIVYKNRSHLQQVDPKRDQNNNNLFELKYPNDDIVYVDASGQTFNESDYTNDEKEPIDWEVLPLEVTDNLGTVTAAYPSDEEDIMFILYDGLQGNDNIAVRSIAGQTLRAQDIYNRFWKIWLTFRANSETVQDSFYVHYTEPINITEGEYKYNTQRLILKIKKQRVTDQHYKVDITAETF